MAALTQHTNPEAVYFDTVRFTYDGEAFVLDGIDLTIAPGEFVCVLGGNGSGKSTLAKHVNALLTPDEGAVYTFGNNTADAEALFTIRSSAGMVFQNPDDQLVATTIEDDVAFGPENLGIESTEIANRVAAALKQVGLRGFEKHAASQLSGGQKQRVAIAGALACKPRLLVLDEATAMLDPQGRASFLRMIKRLHASGLTILMITHSIEEAMAADRIIVMQKGRIVRSGKPAELFSDIDELKELRLSVPFATKLSAQLKKEGVGCTLSLDLDSLVEEICTLQTETSAPAMTAAPARPVEPVWPAEPSQSTEPAAQADAATAAEASDTESPDTESPDTGAPKTEASGVETSDTEPSDTEASDTEALLTFDHVSYSYASAAELKRMAKQAQSQAAIAIKNIENDNRDNDREAQTSAAIATQTSSDGKAVWGKAPDSIWALTDVSFSVRRGTILGVAGHTGSGKSTLMRHMNGILQPTKGRVSFRGHDLSDKKALREFRTRIGMVLQYPEHQLFASSVREDVAFGPMNQGLAADQIDARVREAIALVGLDEEILDASPFELSGGQQRRVAIAGVLACKPEVLVLDEPMAGLDPRACWRMRQLIVDLREQGFTIVIVSHDMDDLALLCDEMLILNSGNVVALSTPRKLFVPSNAARLQAIGLDVPSPAKAAIAFAEAGFKLADEPYTVASLARAIAAQCGHAATNVQAEDCLAPTSHVAGKHAATAADHVAGKHAATGQDAASTQAEGDLATTSHVAGKHAATGQDAASTQTEGGPHE